MTPGANPIIVPQILRPHNIHMIMLRHLHSINLLSTILDKRGASSLGSLQTYTKLLLPSRSRVIQYNMMSTSSSFDDGEKIDRTNNEGRIWLHRPFQITPLVAGDTSGSSNPNPTIIRCPLPKSSPCTSPEEKLNHLHSISSNPEQFRREALQTKVDFYKSQFHSRVTKEHRKRIERRSIQSSLGTVDVTIYFPETNHDKHKLHGICLHVHGGGWIWGDSHDQVGHRCLEMADSMNAAVVSVEYSLVCQWNRHSTVFNPVNDVRIAIEWIEQNGATELNAYNSFVASGESSGAHLLMLALLERRPSSKDQTSGEQSSWSSWKALNLVYGFYDLSGTPSVHADGNKSSPICGSELLWMSDLYCAKIHESKTKEESNIIDKQHPSLNPLHADLSHMPRALFSVGTCDPLLDDTLFMASRYSKAGNHVELAVYEGGEHGLGHFGMQEDEVMGIHMRRHTLEFMRALL